MVNLEHKLTVDDLIVEYAMYKVRNGYETSFTTSEFISFLYFFESKMKVEDSLYENEVLFKRFFERKNESDWSQTNSITKEKINKPHLDMKYDGSINDYIITVNYKLSRYDSSVINTYFMPEGEVNEIRNIIGEYLKDKPKRKIDETLEVVGFYSLMGNYIAAEIVKIIWDYYVNMNIKKQRWPIQCYDIDKYMLETDLASIIGVESIRDDLLKLYKVISKRFAIMFKEDNDLRISSVESSFLANSNYKLLIDGFEEIINIGFGQYKSRFEIDMKKLCFSESHELDGIYDWDDEPDTVTKTELIGNASVKKLVNVLNKSIK